MNSPKDPKIRLFGRMIAFPENGRASASIAADERPCESGGAADCDVNDAELRAEEKVDDEIEKLLQTEKEDVCETKMQEKEQNPCGAEESQNPCISYELDENPKTPSIHEDATSENEQTNGQQKVLKKPDKIIPCPRCNSMETKFCYYNNYNVNQPRHFCKSCQRYWTAGGTMRNVPVGAGRRKNKNLASNCCHITISEALQAARMDSPNGFHHQAFKHNGTVLSFGPDSQLCESMAPALNCSEKQAPNRDDSSMGSSVTTSSSVQKQGENCPQQTVMPNLNGFPFPLPCIPGVAWQFPWNSALPMPAICPPGYPMPFYATPYWNVPWGSLSPTANQMGSNSNPNSPLGKHSRNGELLNPNGLEKQEHFEPKNSESSIVVPKTLRIDDPEEAAKSSIWETLGIKYNSVSREGLFKALQPKGDEKQAMVSASLQANPAALSRSITFQETYSSNASSQVINP